MQKPSVFPIGMLHRGQALKVVTVPPKTAHNLTSTESNRDGGYPYYQNMRTRNFRKKAPEKAELMPAVLRAKSYNNEREGGFKAVSGLIDSQLKEQAKIASNLIDEIVNNPSMSIHSNQHMRPRSSYTAKNFTIKSDSKKNAIRPATDINSSDKFSTYKFLKPLVEEAKTEHENNMEDRTLLGQKQALTSPDSKLRYLFPGEEYSPLKESSKAKEREQAESANCSFDQNDIYMIKQEKARLNQEKRNVDPIIFIQSIGHNSSQKCETEGLISHGMEATNPQMTQSTYHNEIESSIARASQTQRGASQGRKAEKEFVINANFANLEKITQIKDGKPLNSNSPNRKYRIRPPTSPSHSLSQNSQNVQNSLPQQNKGVTPPNLMSKSSLPVNNVAGATNEIYINFLDMKSKKNEQSATALSPVKPKKEALSDKDKIIDIRQQILTSEIFKGNSTEKARTNFVVEQSETCENSVVEDDLSQEDFGCEEEEDIEESCPTNRTSSKKVFLLESVYAARPPTIFFPYPACCGQTRDANRTYLPAFEDEKNYELKYKTLSILCVTRTFEAAGLKKTNGSTWNVLWGKPKYDRVKEMNKYQKTNHFPGCWEVGRKDGLWRNLSKMKRQFPNDYTFLPNTYLLATDYERFSQIKDNAENKAIWIMKPCASACGRGIKLINKKTKLAKNKNFLVSEYISNPHLIDGLKYDLRIYVLVTSFDPLRIYLYDEGLVRFATEKYSTTKKDLKEKFAHLTNWSVNKQSANFVKNQDVERDGEGSKWSFSALKAKFAQLNIDYNGIFEKIKDIIIKTMIGVEPLMLHSVNRSPDHRNNCFELFGFDVLLDANLKPWLMEVNVCPSSNSSTPLDKKIKTSLICDIMNLIGIQPYHRKKCDEESKKRLLGQDSRKYVAKNYNDVLNLDETNCLEKLSADDWNVLFETDEEWHRRGNFERIFPLKESAEIYSKYFEYPRYNNLIVSQWLKSKTNFLELISEKISQASC